MNDNAVSVVVVSDYAPHAAASNRRLLEVLRALGPAADDVEHILVTGEGELSDDDVVEAARVLPGLRRIACADTSSYARKNLGVREARGEWVALLDADCLPAPGWVAAAREAFARHPEAAVVSGRTTYAGRSLTERCLGLLSRSFVDRPSLERTAHISNNNAAYRRTVFMAHPLPLDAGPFASSVQSAALLAAGHAAYFQPAMRVEHAFEGWAMEADIRRNLGWSAVTLRQTHATLPLAWLVALGPAAVPALCAGRVVRSVNNAVRYAEAYGVRRRQLPYAAALAVACGVLEVPGMLRALRGRDAGVSAYR